MPDGLGARKRKGGSSVRLKGEERARSDQEGLWGPRLALNLQAVLTRYKLKTTIRKRIVIITIPIVLTAPHAIGHFLSARHSLRHLPPSEGVVLMAAQ